MNHRIIYLASFSLLLSAASSQAEVAVSNAWVRATIGGGAVTAGYAVITNAGPLPDRLIEVSSTQAGRIELHQSSSKGGMMTMSPVETLQIDAAERVELKPGDYHLMLLQLRAPLKTGETMPLRFRFERQGNVDVVAKVAPLAATTAPAP